MSYSRWSNSRWYTFWSSTIDSEMEFKYPSKDLKYKQTFEICDIPSYYLTYGDIEVKGIKKILEEVENLYSKDLPFRESIEDIKLLFKEQVVPRTPPTWREMRELQDYIFEFKKDVDNHFKLFNFIKYEWYYPIRNKILLKWKKIKKKKTRLIH
jgi:hypothetical protein